MSLNWRSNTSMSPPILTWFLLSHCLLCVYVSGCQSLDVWHNHLILTSQHLQRPISTSGYNQVPVVITWIYCLGPVVYESTPYTLVFPLDSLSGSSLGLTLWGSEQFYSLVFTQEKWKHMSTKRTYTRMFLAAVLIIHNTPNWETIRAT